MTEGRTAPGADPLADFDLEIVQFLQAAGVAEELITLSTPPEREFGERSSNAAFRLARERRQAPRHIAQSIAEGFDPGAARYIARVEAAGNGFLNFFLNYERFTPAIVDAVRAPRAVFGRRSKPARRFVVEHTSVNPNKEWHIGHVRNAVLGDVLGRLLRLVGDNVEIQNYIDDTGLQAAQAVVGLLDFPEQQHDGEKYDHFIGRLYVKIAAELGAERELKERLEMLVADPGQAQRFGNVDERTRVRARLENIGKLQKRVLGVMHQLERGEHHDVVAAIVRDQLKTAFRLGVYYDLLSWESHLVKSNIFAEAMQILEESPRVRRPREGRYRGALIIDTGEPAAPGDEPKSEVLIRSSGLPTYVAKDIAYHMWKFYTVPDRLYYRIFLNQPNDQPLWTTTLDGEDRDVPVPDQVINVIAVNQSQAQQAVKEGLRAGGFADVADDLVHLGYGLVSTREGRLSGRRGTSASGDAVIDEAVAVAFDRVREKRSNDLSEEEMRAIAEAVGVGAVRYFMVQYNPLRDIVFDVSDVVSYDGNTGLYIQYALVRMFAILRRAETEHSVRTEDIEGADASLLVHEQEKRLIYHVALYPGLLADAARTLAINLVAEYAFDLATIFSQFYRDCAVLSADPIALRYARLLLVRTVRDVLVSACGVLGVPVIERL